MLHRFGGRLPYAETRKNWLVDLDKVITPNKVILHKDTGFGFSFVKFDFRICSRKSYASMHEFLGGVVASFQQVVASFHPLQPRKSIFFFIGQC